MRILACITLGIAIAASGFAQSTLEKPREQIWKFKWVRSAINELEKAGLWCKGDVLIEGRPPSNYEIAVGVLESVRQIRQATNEAKATVDALEERHAPPTPLNEARLTLPATIEKLNSFKHPINIAEQLSAHLVQEINNLGVEAESVNSDLSAQRLEIEQVYSRGVLAAARTYKLPESPKYAYVRETLRGLKSDGFASGYGGLFAGCDARGYKAQELIACCDDFTKFSGMARSLISNIKSRLQTKPLPSDMTQIKLDLNNADSIVGLLTEWSGKRKALNRTIDFFSLEIKALGRDPNKLKNQLKEAL